MAQLTRTNAEQIMTRLKSTLAELSKEFGISVKIEQPKFDGLALKATLIMASIDASGQARSREKEDWERWSPTFDLAPSDFGRAFIFKRSQYTIVGLNLGAPKYAINARRQDGKIFRFPAPLVKSLLGGGGLRRAA